MAKKFSIINQSLVIEDTVTSTVDFDRPKARLYYDVRKLENDIISIVDDEEGTYYQGSSVFKVALSDAVDSTETAFTKTSFVAFVRDNMGFKTVSGGSETEADGVVSSVSWTGRQVTLSRTEGLPSVSASMPLATDAVDGAMSSSDKGKLDDLSTDAEENVQADWNETDANSDAYIANKPSIRTDEEIRDISAAQLQDGENITITKDDDSDSITIDVTGAFEQSRITGLHDDLIDRSVSPNNTTVGNFPTYSDSVGNIGAGAGFVGNGGMVVTTDEHGKIPLGIEREEHATNFPNFVQVGYTANISVTSSNASQLADKVNIMDGSNLSITIDEADSLPLKSDLFDSDPTDDNTLVFLNLNSTPLTISITNPAHTFRTNFGTISGGLSIPQLHYVSLCRGDVTTSRVYLLKASPAPITSPRGLIRVTDFTIANDVPTGTVISGTQTVTFEAFNALNMDRDDLFINLSTMSGGVSASVNIDASSHIIKEGTNTFSFTFPTLPLPNAGDYVTVGLTFGLISPNVEQTSDNVWRVDARAADHPTQGTFKYGWLDGGVDIASFNSSTINDVDTWSAANVLSDGAIVENDIPSALTVPGVDEDGKRFMIEVQGDLGDVARIIENAGTSLQRVVYDDNNKMSTTSDYNAITYTKDVNGTTKNFTLIYTRLLKLEAYEGSVLKITQQ